MNATFFLAFFRWITIGILDLQDKNEEEHTIIREILSCMNDIIRFSLVSVSEHAMNTKLETETMCGIVS